MKVVQSEYQQLYVTTWRIVARSDHHGRNSGPLPSQIRIHHRLEIWRRLAAFLRRRSLRHVQWFGTIFNTVTATAASTIMNSSVSKGWTPSMDLVEKDNIDLKKWWWVTFFARLLTWAWHPLETKTKRHIPQVITIIIYKSFTWLSRRFHVNLFVIDSIKR